MMNNRIEIIHKPTAEEPFIVINKPSHLPSAPLKDGDESALTQAIECFPEIKQVNGKKSCEYGLLHRIDNDTSGLLLIAVTQNFYDYMWQQQDSGLFEKTYAAVCKKVSLEDDSYPLFDERSFSSSGLIVSRFRPFGEKSRLVRPVTEDSGKYVLRKASPKEYTTKVSFSELADGHVLATCCLTQGYRHQVRVHLAWSGNPIVGDPLYFPDSPEDNENESFKFCACGIKFIDSNGITQKFEIKPQWM